MGKAKRSLIVGEGSRLPVRLGKQENPPNADRADHETLRAGRSTRRRGYPGVIAGLSFGARQRRFPFNSLFRHLV